MLHILLIIIPWCTAADKRTSDGRFIIGFIALWRLQEELWVWWAQPVVTRCKNRCYKPAHQMIIRYYWELGITPTLAYHSLLLNWEPDYCGRDPAPPWMVKTLEIDEPSIDWWFGFRIPSTFSYWNCISKNLSPPFSNQIICYPFLSPWLCFGLPRFWLIAFRQAPLKLPWS